MNCDRVSKRSVSCVGQREKTLFVCAYKHRRIMRFPLIYKPLAALFHGNRESSYRVVLCDHCMVLMREVQLPLDKDRVNSAVCHVLVLVTAARTIIPLYHAPWEPVPAVTKDSHVPSAAELPVETRKIKKFVACLEGAWLCA